MDRNISMRSSHPKKKKKKKQTKKKMMTRKKKKKLKKKKKKKKKKRMRRRKKKRKKKKRKKKRKKKKKKKKKKVVKKRQEQEAAREGLQTIATYGYAHVEKYARAQRDWRATCVPSKEQQQKQNIEQKLQEVAAADCNFHVKKKGPVEGQQPSLSRNAVLVSVCV